MSSSLKELDYQQTELGELILRVRHSPALGAELYEVKLNGAFLMSSAVNDSEVALANLGIAAWGDGPCDVLVGGLGLGCTAATVLEHPRVRQLDVVEFLEPVIDWHHRRLVPSSNALMDDPRCTLIHDNFFEYVAHSKKHPQRRYDVILLDIDHSPESWLDASNEQFYSVAGLKEMARHLKPAGVFAIWSAEAPDPQFSERLREVFGQVTSHDIAYHNPLFGRTDVNVVIVAR